MKNHSIEQVSFIVPCYNARPWIGEALCSILEQGAVDPEIIVVDDGSTDDSADIVEKEFPSVRLVRTVNQGPSKARNLGTRLSKGSFIQYLDADDLLLPGKVGSQVKALTGSGADAAYGDWQKLIETDDDAYQKGEEIRQAFNEPATELVSGKTWRPVSSFLFRREIVERVGGWNERLPFIQDVRFMIDCVLRGARLVYCPGLAVSYRVRKTDSISTRNPIEHTRDCLRNACEIEEWWRSHGGLDKTRKDALLKAYGYAARASFGKDKETFCSAKCRIEALDPSYVPEGSRLLKMALWCGRMKEALLK